MLFSPLLPTKTIQEVTLDQNPKKAIKLLTNTEIDIATAKKF